MSVSHRWTSGLLFRPGLEYLFTFLSCAILASSMSSPVKDRISRGRLASFEVSSPKSFVSRFFAPCISGSETSGGSPGFRTAPTFFSDSSRFRLRLMSSQLGFGLAIGFFLSSSAARARLLPLKDIQKRLSINNKIKDRLSTLVLRVGI